MNRRSLIVGGGSAAVVGIAALTSRGSAQDGSEATIIAQGTRIAELEGTVAARGQKINAQRTQIAELRDQVPEPTSEPSNDGQAVDSFGVWDVSVEQMSLFDVVGGDTNTHSPLGVFVAVHLIATNTGNTPERFPSNEIRLVDDAGRQYSYALEPTSSYFVYNLGGGIRDDLQPGLPAPVQIVFDVPRGGEIVSIQDESRSLFLQAPEPIAP